MSTTIGEAVLATISHLLFASKKANSPSEELPDHSEWPFDWQGRPRRNERIG
jgi:hypothetical protein